MHIKLGNHYAEILIIDTDPEDPDYVVWEFVDEGIEALAAELELHDTPEMIALFKKASSAAYRSDQEDIAAERHYARQ